MLKAILEGKAGRVSAEGFEEQSWRDIFRKREDLLTAVFFSRLRYLSKEGELNVLSLLVGDKLAQRLGCINEVIFWPKIKGLDGRKYVEPDVLIFFKYSLLLIEVKPPFGGMQYEDQWNAQVKSLILLREEASSEITIPQEFHFLALGRNSAESQQAAENLRESYFDEGLGSVHRHEWDDVCRGIHQLADVEQGRDRVVYEDWIDSFYLFGLIEPPLPFADLRKLEQITILDWRAAMHSFEAPMNNRSSSSVVWQELAALTNKIRLEAQIWK